MAAKEPYRVTRNDAGCNASTLLRKAVAALRGPMVWDDDGPYPILYMVLMVSIGSAVVGAFLDTIQYGGYEVMDASLIIGIGIFVETVCDNRAYRHATVSHKSAQTLQGC